MTESRVSKLRELAERGVGGEKENAKAILSRLGIDWKKPKNSFQDRVKKTFGGDITRTYEYKIVYASDLLLIARLMFAFEVTSQSINLTDGGRIQIKCEQSQYEDIRNVMTKHRKEFDSAMIVESGKYVNEYLKV